jgi:hypothetical protein
MQELLTLRISQTLIPSSYIDKIRGGGSSNELMRYCNLGSLQNSSKTANVAIIALSFSFMVQMEKIKKEIIYFVHTHTHTHLRNNDKLAFISRYCYMHALKSMIITHVYVSE